MHSRNIRLLFAAIVWAVVTVIMAGCGKPSDPIVGKWVDNQNGEMSWAFKDDGTAVLAVDYDKRRARLNRVYPGVDSVVDASIEKQRRLVQEVNTAHWEVAAGGYNVTTRLRGPFPCQLSNKNSLLVNTDQWFTRVPN